MGDDGDRRNYPEASEYSMLTKVRWLAPQSIDRSKVFSLAPDWIVDEKPVYQAQSRKVE